MQTNNATRKICEAKPQKTQQVSSKTQGKVQKSMQHMQKNM